MITRGGVSVLRNRYISARYKELVRWLSRCNTAKESVILSECRKELMFQPVKRSSLQGSSAQRLWMKSQAGRRRESGPETASIRIG